MSIKVQQKVKWQFFQYFYSIAHSIIKCSSGTAKSKVGVKIEFNQFAEAALIFFLFFSNFFCSCWISGNFHQEINVAPMHITYLSEFSIYQFFLCLPYFSLNFLCSCWISGNFHQEIKCCSNAHYLLQTAIIHFASFIS